MTQRLGLSVATGLQEVLAGNSALEPAVLKTPIAGLYLIAARAEDNATIGRLSAEALAWLLAWLYIRKSNNVFDQLVARVIERAKQIKGARS